ncbi:TetR/AcrR family transcriptional regulator [Streptosporangium sp. NPDC006013]|uniref:TetR/AcrR family transcriptional regulator n=1 Tax=Streptosporangium sp. NPDC006013 TaxID=3155596 RepID=UPI0033BE0217
MSEVNGRNRRSAQTRLRVVEAAHGLFVTHGHTGTTFQEIADAAGVSAPTGGGWRVAGATRPPHEAPFRMETGKGSPARISKIFRRLDLRSHRQFIINVFHISAHIRFFRHNSAFVCLGSVAGTGSGIIRG